MLLSDIGKPVLVKMDSATPIVTKNKSTGEWGMDSLEEVTPKKFERISGAVLLAYTDTHVFIGLSGRCYKTPIDKVKVIG